MYRFSVVCLTCLVVLLVDGCSNSSNRYHNIVQQDASGMGYARATGGTGYTRATGGTGYAGATGGTGYAGATGGTGGQDALKMDSGGINDGGVVVPIDATAIDAAAMQGDATGVVTTGGVGEAGDVSVVDDAADEANIERCTTNCIDLQWVEIPGGTFMMGSAGNPENTVEQPLHEVTVKRFEMAKTEVTVAQYASCVEAGVCSEPFVQVGASAESPNWTNWDNPGRENHPVNSVDWNQARAFAEWVGARLPSEAEWEYAARGGGLDVIYPWGDEAVTCEHAVLGYDLNRTSCSTGSTAEVCSKPLDNTTQGLCDMAGNVMEWVEDDLHADYQNAPTDGRAWIDEPRSEFRITRGSYWQGMPDYCLCTSRAMAAVPPDERHIGIGFRVARDL